MIVHIPLAMRIVIYLVLSGYALDLLANFLGISGSRFPGPFSIFFFPVALALLLGLAVGKSHGKAYWPGNRISLTGVGPRTINLQFEAVTVVSTTIESYSPQPTLPRRLSIGLGMVLLGSAGIAGLVCVALWAGPWARNCCDEILVMVTLASLLILWSGIGLLAFWTTQEITQALARRSELKLFQHARYHFLPKVHKPLRAKFSTLPSFGLVAALITAFILFALASLSRDWSKGIKVLLLPQRPLSTRTSGFDQALIVRVIRGSASRPGYYLNSRPVSLEQLSTALRAQLKLRPDRVVYIDVERELSFQAAIDVMDEAQGVEARIVLLKTQTKSASAQRSVVRK